MVVRRNSYFAEKVFESRAITHIYQVEDDFGLIKILPIKHQLLISLPNFK